MIGSQCIRCVNMMDDGTCIAFPDGIPQQILSGHVDHSKSYPGDNGITFRSLSGDVKLNYKCPEDPPGSGDFRCDNGEGEKPSGKKQRRREESYELSRPEPTTSEERSVSKLIDLKTKKYRHDIFQEKKINKAIFKLMVDKVEPVSDDRISGNQYSFKDGTVIKASEGISAPVQRLYSKTKELHPTLSKYIKHYEIHSERHPRDAEREKEIGFPALIAATAYTDKSGTIMSFWGINETGAHGFEQIVHEAAHAMDHEDGFEKFKYSGSDEWKNAFVEDGGTFISKYAEAAFGNGEGFAEDFADFMGEFHEYPRDITLKYPARAKVARRLLEGGK